MICCFCCELLLCLLRSDVVAVSVSYIAAAAPVTVAVVNYCVYAGRICDNKWIDIK